MCSGSIEEGNWERGRLKNEQCMRVCLNFQVRQLSVFNAALRWSQQLTSNAADDGSRPWASQAVRDFSGSIPTWKKIRFGHMSKAAAGERSDGEQNLKYLGDKQDKRLFTSVLLSRWNCSSRQHRSCHQPGRSGRLNPEPCSTAF